MSSTSTILLQNAIETIDNLNLSTQSMNGSTHVPGASDGLYAMINKMISDLASIRSAIKVEEKNISRDITQHIKMRTDGLDTTADVLLTSITTDTTDNTTTTNQTDLSTTTNGAGSGAILTIAGTAGTGDISTVTVTTAGTGYAIGDTLTVLATDMTAATTNLVFTLGAGDIDAGLSRMSSFNIATSKALLSTPATLSLDDGIGSGTYRHETDPASPTHLPGVYITKIGATTRAYSEDAVFGILANAAEIIKKLKSGQITATAAAAPATANVTTVQ